jgi:hypothetical protein
MHDRFMTIQETVAAQYKLPVEQIQSALELTRHYCERIRQHPREERLQACSALLELIRDGDVTLDEARRAVDTYAADPYQQASDPRLRRNVRKFLGSPELIREWQHPVRHRIVDDNEMLRRLEDRVFLGKSFAA